MTPLHSDIFSHFGEPLPENAAPCIHSFEDRFCVSDLESRRVLVARLHELYGEPADAGVIGFAEEQWNFPWLARLCQRRRFLRTQCKHGLHVRTSCVVTDGLGLSESVRLLMSRSAVSGDVSRSLLFSSSQPSFGHLDAAPHAVSSVLGEELVLPVADFESRLACVAFDLRSLGSEVVDFIWHVRVASPLPGAVVPACDLPFSGTDCKGPFRQRLLEWCDVFSLLSSPGIIDAEQEGLLRRLLTAEPTSFVRNIGQRSPLWLLRLFQQAAHAGIRSLSGGMSVTEFLEDMLLFWREELPDTVAIVGLDESDECSSPNVPFRVRRTGSDVVPLLIEVPSANRCVGVALAMQDSVGVSESHAEIIGDWYGQHPELRGKLTGLALVCGVRQCRPFVCHNALSLWHSPIPVDVVRIAVNPRSPKLSTRGVAHAVIPFDVHGQSDWKLVVTRQRHDESTRLPGGKLEFGETPEQAVRRECFEELGLVDSDLAVLKPIPMPPLRSLDGLTVGEVFVNEHVTRLVSPKTGELTCYLLYPFWVELTAVGREKILKQLGKPKHFPKLINAEFWRTTGLGYDCEYPQRICESVRDWLQVDESDAS